MKKYILPLLLFILFTFSCSLTPLLNFSNEIVDDTLQTTLNQVILISPGNYATTDSIYPEFDWSDVYDESAVYQFQLSDSNSFTNLIVDETGLRDSNHTISTHLDFDTTYYWRVRSLTLDDTGSWSTIYQFVTLLPAAPIVSYPENNSTITTDDVLTWDSLDETISYSLQISESETFDNNVIEVNNLYYPSYNLNDSISSSTQYYWRVKRNFTNYSSAWSETHNFITLSNNSFTNFQDISDAEIDHSRNMLYLVDHEAYKLYAYNYSNSEITELNFDNQPENICLHNGKLYLTLLTGEHSSYWWEEDQTGQIAVVDADTLTIDQIVDIAIDPYDIALDNDGYIFIPSGSGQWTDFNVYDSSFNLITSAMIRQMSPLIYNSILDRFYSVTTDSSPRDIDGWELTDSMTLSGDDSPYHGDYTMTAMNFISPDGNYLYNSSGNIFQSSNDSNEDLIFVESLGFSYNYLTFDTVNDKVYFAGTDDIIYTYQYSTLNLLNSNNIGVSISFIYYVDNQLIYISESDSGIYSIEMIDAF